MMRQLRLASVRDWRDVATNRIQKMGQTWLGGIECIRGLPPLSPLHMQRAGWLLQKEQVMFVRMVMWYARKSIWPDGFHFQYDQ